MNEVGVQAASLKQRRGKRISGWVKFGVEIGPLFLFFFWRMHIRSFSLMARLSSYHRRFWAARTPASSPQPSS